MKETTLQNKSVRTAQENNQKERKKEKSNTTQHNTTKRNELNRTIDRC